MGSTGRLRVFLVTSTISNIGTWATLIALWGAAQYRFGIGAGGVTALALGWSLPMVVLAPVVGLTIDRFGPGRVLFVSQAGSIAVLVAMIATNTFVPLVLLSVVGGMAKAFTEPATYALPPRLVDDIDLPRLNSAMRMTGFLAIVIGPAVGAFAIDAFGFDGAFWADAASFGIGLAGLSFLPLDRLGGRLEHRRSNLRADMAEGWHIVRGSFVLRRVVLATTSISVLYGSSLVLEPLSVKRVLHRSASTYGWLQSSFGIALVLTGFYVMRHANRFSRLAVCSAAAVGAGITAVIYLCSTSVVVAFVGVTTWGAATAFFSSPSATLLHRHAPGEAHGRVLAFERMIDAGIKLTGTLTAGLLAGGLGVRAAAMIFAAVSLGISVPALGLAMQARPADARLPA